MIAPRIVSQASRRRQALILAGLLLLTVGAIVPMTLEDFHLSGTQIGDVQPSAIRDAQHCALCHGDYDPAHEPYATWKGSLMGNAGRDPLFFAQMTNANQDVDNVGYFCMRCHVPLSFVTGHAYQPGGGTLDNYDRDGVNCHFCHAMVDPIYTPGVSPPEDQAILDGLLEVPAHYANAMFVLDPAGARRGPRADAQAPHEMLHSPFHKSAAFCGTCHDVGNVAVSRQPDGSYRYNTIDQRTPDENPATQFPLERTYTEWKLSAFANGGVNMGGRFGGVGGPMVSTCQDCHMPRAAARACFIGPDRSDVAVHDFAGASSWVLEIIGLHYQNDPDVDQAALAAGRAKAIDMVQRAASLRVEQDCGALRVRVINETGHKIPTGHIEGRRIWAGVKFFDAAGARIAEYGAYDPVEAHLDEHSTHVYEMKIGLSPLAAQITGLPAGETTRMSLADTIVKDNRIPPRGFNNAAFAAAGAPVVAAAYADGQYWDDIYYNIPPTAVRAEVGLFYQTVTRHYIEALRDGNHTDQWGNILHGLWEQTGRAPPVFMTGFESTLTPVIAGDLNCDSAVDPADLALFVDVLVGVESTPSLVARADLTHDGVADGRDVQLMTQALLAP